MDQPEPTPRRSPAHAALQLLPTLIVLACLAAVGWWGHRSGWKAPSLAELVRGAAKPADDWCAEHGVPESRCTLCHPGLALAGEVEPTDTDVKVSAGESADNAGKARNPATCQKHALRVQLASVATLDKVGIRLGKVVERPMAATLSVLAEADYDRTRFATVTARVPGIARHPSKALGDRVRQGELLALIDSAEAGKAKAELLQAQAALDAAEASAARLARSTEAGLRTEAERVQASAVVREASIRLFLARQALLALGLPVPEGAPSPEAIARLGLPETLPAGVVSANLVPVVAPLDGVVVAREVVDGVAVETGRPLFEIADPSRMWIAMDVAEADAARVVLGADVVFRPDSARDDAVAGRVRWISTAVDERTRTVKVHAEAANEHGGLRAHAFGRARIVLRSTPNAIAVPSEALQWEGCCWVVFVCTGDAVFQTRKVRLGVQDAAWTEVLVGVLPGEVVATRGSHVLKSEILKSELGAGCCGDER